MAYQEQFDVGDTAELSAEFRVTRTNVLTDPAALTVTVKPPTGSNVIYTYGVDAQIVKDATGVYRCLIDCAMSGTYNVYWKGTGAAKAAKSVAFKVRPMFV